MNLWINPLELTAFAFVLANCVDQRCFEQADCPAPQLCGASGLCFLECEVAEDCGPGFLCDVNRCAPDSDGPIACPGDMVAVAEAFCIDRYESSRPDATAETAGVDSLRASSVVGVLPWQVASNAEAALACSAAEKRLCRSEEWELACSGEARTAYGYGDTYDPTRCNGIDAFDRRSFHLVPTGTFPECTSPWGAFDLNGNLWEHVAEGTDRTVRGGAYNCSDSAQYNRCDYVPNSWTPSALGFRCCLTPNADDEQSNGPVEGTR